MLDVNNLNVILSKKKILDNVSFNVEENDFLTIMGPNGSGKTTIIKCIMNDLKYTGNITLNNSKIVNISFKDMAKKIGVLTQNHNLEFDSTVYDIVSIGRYTHITDIFGKLKSNDISKIDDVMKLTNIYNLKDKSVNNISGGELQRVFLAQVLAQDPDILILDEPTNHLDIKHQIEIFDILKNWSLKNHRAVIAIVHDLNLAFSYSNKSLLLSGGKIVSKGYIENVLTRENLKISYDIDVYDWMSNLISRWK